MSLVKLTLKSHELARAYQECYSARPARRLINLSMLAFLVLLSANSQIFSNHHQIGQRFGAHFSHDVASVNLYCPFAYADLACDLLVHKAAGHQRHDLALARG